MRNTIQNLSYPYLMLILIIHLPFTRMETMVHVRPYHPSISLTPMLVLASPASFSFFNGRKSTWCHPHAFPASAEAKGCAPIPSRLLGQPHDRHPIHQIVAAGGGGPSRACRGSSSRLHARPQLQASTPTRECDGGRGTGGDSRGGGVDSGQPGQILRPSGAASLTSISPVAVSGGEEEDEDWAWA